MKNDTEQPLILSGLEPEDITTVLNNEPSYRSRQIFRWVHRGVESFDSMTNIPATLRQALRNKCMLSSTRLSEVQESEDGTRKYRLTLADGLSVESVILVDIQGRQTACLSTQVGCAMGCAFCRTGTMGFKRNLQVSEIVEQYHQLRSESGRISNIVFMGMGEPFMNMENLYKSIRILTHPDGPALSPRRLTVSTCGIAPEILTLHEKAPGVRLAVSLPSADREKRNNLMPGASRYSIEELKSSIAVHQAATGDRITIETVLFGGINTGRDDAVELVSFADGLNAVVNLIPFNPFEGSPFKEPSRDEIAFFTSALEKNGLKVTRRYRRGRGILGACGQLAT